MMKRTAAAAAFLSALLLCSCGETSAPAQTSAATTTAAETTTTAAETTTTAKAEETTASETSAAPETTASETAEENLSADEETAGAKDIAGTWFETDALDPRTLTINEDGTFALVYKGGGTMTGTVTTDHEVSGDGSKRLWYSLRETDDEVWVSFPESEDGTPLTSFSGITADGEVSFTRAEALFGAGDGKNGPIALAMLKTGTDLQSYSNAEAHRFDDGELSVDLDGDGTDEVLDLTHTNTITVFDEEVTERAFYINGTEIKAVKKCTADEYADHYEAVDSFSDYYYICDIDSSDKYKEIAIVPCTFTNEYETYFYRYENGTLSYIGDITYDVPDPATENDIQLGVYITDGNPMIIDGSGIITAAVRCDAPQTWFGYCPYSYDEANGFVPMDNTEVYPYGYDLKDDYNGVLSLMKDSFYSEGCSLLKATEVYRTPSEDSEHFTMEPQPACPTGVLYHSYDWESSDYDFWVYITAEDGTGGWIHYTEYPDYEDPLFSALTLYD